LQQIKAPTIKLFKDGASFEQKTRKNTLTRVRFHEQLQRQIQNRLRDSVSSFAADDTFLSRERNLPTISKIASYIKRATDCFFIEKLKQPFW